MYKFCRRKISILLVLFLFMANSYCQKEIPVRKIEGEYIISQDITLKEAKEKAFEDAKKKALREAGISENISSTNVLATNAAEDFEQTFNEFSSVEINGRVVEWEILSEDRHEDEFGNLIQKVVINAVVVKYETEKDPSFNIKIEGIEDYYKEGTNLNFSFLPYKPGYLKLFYFDENLKCDMIFPNLYEKNRIFHALDAVHFPISNMIEYEMVTEKEKEVNHMVFVYTKKNIPFTEKITYKNLLKWLYMVPPEQRVVKYFTYVIKGDN